MAGMKGRGNEACCAVLDCVETTVALLEHHETESTVMIGETVFTLPSAWVHPAHGPTGMWCFIPQPTAGGQPGAYIDSQGRTRAIPTADAGAGEHPVRFSRQHQLRDQDGPLLGAQGHVWRCRSSSQSLALRLSFVSTLSWSAEVKKVRRYQSVTMAVVIATAAACIKATTI